MQIDTAPANYNPNSIGDNWPRETPEAAEDGGFTTTPERVEGIKTCGWIDLSDMEAYIKRQLFNATGINPAIDKNSLVLAAKLSTLR